MTIQNIDVDAAVDKVKALIASEKDLSPALKASLEVLLLLVTILANSHGLNSKNSSKPPSTDKNRVKEPKSKSDRKPGAHFLLANIAKSALRPVKSSTSILPEWSLSIGLKFSWTSIVIAMWPHFRMESLGQYSTESALRPTLFICLSTS